MVAQIAIPVANVSDLISLGFTKLEVWITDKYANEYYEITDSTAQPATIQTVEAQTTYRMGGHELKLIVDGGTEESITFSSLIDFWTPTQVSNRINEVVTGLSSVSGNSIILESSTSGRVSSLEITYIDTNVLGISSGMKVYGKDPRLTLIGGTVSYTYTDVQGTVGQYYKWRYTANGVNPKSQYYGPVAGLDLPVSGVLTSIATAKFIGPDGRPFKGKIYINAEGQPFAISGYNVIFQDTITVEADDTGFLQYPLVQGTQITVAIEGTKVVREITVPNTSSFDLLSAIAAAPDPFTVQTTPPYLIRRSI